MPEAPAPATITTPAPTEQPTPAVTVAPNGALVIEQPNGNPPLVIVTAPVPGGHEVA